MEARETKKFVMLDHGGVLDDFSETVNKGDLVLSRVVGGGFRIFKNGVAIVKLLNTLVNDFGYQIVFHSANREEQQIDCLNKLYTACREQGLAFPHVYAMAVLNNDKYQEVLPSNPDIGMIEYNDGKNNYEIKAACYGQVIEGEESAGKRDIRQALSLLLNITPEERAQHIVFDDGENVIEKAKQDGYQACHVVNGLEIENTLKEIIKAEKGQNKNWWQGFFSSAQKKQKAVSMREAMDDPSQEYQELVQHRNQLAQELNDNKGMHKERKQLKMIFLDDVLTHYEKSQNSEKSITDSVKIISASYHPSALKKINAGIKSNRTQALLSKFNK